MVGPVLRRRHQRAVRPGRWWPRPGRHPRPSCFLAGCHATWVLAGFALGILTLSAGRFAEVIDLHEGGPVLAVIGGLLLAASHGASMGRCRACEGVCEA